jgi:SAM-dependent methyltransferase
MSEEIFWRAHEGLPRQAPGSEETTALLLTLSGVSPKRIVDLGCGTGASALPLARLTGAEVVGVDTHQPFLDALTGIQAVNASMDDLPFADGEFDLVWAEGSAYLIGFDRALSLWRRLIAPGGALVLTEAEWLTSTPAPAARQFWDAGYPAMRTTAGNVAAATAAGWLVAATYVLPDADWAAYYGPLGERVAALGPEAAFVQEEIDVREAHGADYGYTGYVLKPR